MAYPQPQSSFVVVEQASSKTTVLLVHVPYPGRLKFDGVPSSLLHAFAPFLAGVTRGDVEATVGLLDTRVAGVEFFSSLRAALVRGTTRVVCLSVSSLAVEEAAAGVALVREVLGDGVLVVAGGPHEDGCDVKMACGIEGVDLSIGGDAELVLDWILRRFLRGDQCPRQFCTSLVDDLGHAGGVAGRVEVSSPWWVAGPTRPFDFGPLALDALPPRPWPTRVVRFPVFDAEATLPLMISRGCSYGRCDFCSEPSAGGGQVTMSHFGWLAEVVARNPGAAVYFQDSIFPLSGPVRAGLLPMLRDLRVEWGCQLYLPRTTKETMRTLAEHGCRYLYTGVESASPELLRAVGKIAVDEEGVLRRLKWAIDAEMRVGVSLLFGALSPTGAVIDTVDSVDGTVRLAERVVRAGVDVTGFYPNVETVLPGTKRERGLRAAGVPLDFYRVPRCAVFDELEDGAVGYNFMTIPTPADHMTRERVAQRVVAASRDLLTLGARRW